MRVKCIRGMGNMTCLSVYASNRSRDPDSQPVDYRLLATMHSIMNTPCRVSMTMMYKIR